MEVFTFIKIGLEGQEDILYGYEYVSSHTLLAGLIRRFQISPLRTPPQRILSSSQVSLVAALQTWKCRN